jgi:hypothetical protein
MGRKPKGPPVLSLHASADASSPGQRAQLQPPRPSPVNLEDVPEFADEIRRREQASRFQILVQAVMVGTLLYRWFKNRNKGNKPKPPRDPPSQR